MPRYFFNVYHNGPPQLDKVGEELPDKHAAWREATITAGKIIEDIDGRLKPGQDWRLEVTDKFAQPLCSMFALIANSDVSVEDNWNRPVIRKLVKSDP